MSKPSLTDQDWRYIYTALHEYQDRVLSGEFGDARMQILIQLSDDLEALMQKIGVEGVHMLDYPWQKGTNP